MSFQDSIYDDKITSEHCGVVERLDDEEPQETALVSQRHERSLNRVIRSLSTSTLIDATDGTEQEANVEVVTTFAPIRSLSLDSSAPPILSTSSIVCSVCFEDFSSMKERMECGHVFCSDCIFRVFRGKKKQKCPQCRKVCRWKKNSVCYF